MSYDFFANYFEIAMYRRRRGELCWLEFEVLRGLPGVKHGVFLRHGGVSMPPFGSLNCGVGVGDELAQVKENRRRVQAVLGAERVVYSRQVHGHAVVAVGGRGGVSGFPADALTTDCRGISLATTCADCQCALMYDPVRGVVANVHAGWRGSVLGIYTAAVRSLQRRYGCHPRDLLVGIGPSLGPERAEFVNYQKELSTHFWSYRVGDCHFDFWSIARAELEACGIRPDHIEIAGICNYDNPTDCFSYRRDVVTGRHAVAITLF